MKQAPLLALALFGLTLAACASPPAALQGPPSDRAAGDDDDDDDDAAAPAAVKAAPKATPSSSAPTAAPAPTVPPLNTKIPETPATKAPAPFTVKASLGKRLGDDDAQENSGTSVNQLQSLLLVHVPTHTLAAKLTGAELDQAKDSIGSGDGLTVTFAGTAPDGMYALVDGALYYPSADLSLAPGMDLEHFPRGVVGYMNVVYYPNGTGAGTGASDIVWSGYELGELLMGHAERLKSPLVIDLAGKGVTFDAPRPIFDVDGDGKKDRLAWVASTDTPFLVRDRNHNGKIDSIHEMFGDGTLDRNGTTRTSKNGFEALAQYDANEDGALDAKDPAFQELALWFDKNHDGVTDDGELETLAAHGLRRIDLGYAALDLRLSFGNRVLQQSTASTKAGNVAVYDVWFRLD